MKKEGYIGIDFGTTNSHFAYARLGKELPQAIPIMLGDSQGGSVSTCVLWKAPGRAESDFFLYGDKASEEWIMLDSIEEQRTYRFSAGFKPDLVSMEEARLDAWAFLRQAYLEMKKTRQPPAIGDENGWPVVIGVPAEIGTEHQKLTKEIGAKAGFGKVSCVPEPLGALAYHLALGQVTDEEAQKGVVVVDFGGGTLDIALLDKNGIREPWGNPSLGGRLFDDIFFQWVVDENNVDVGQFSPDELLYGWLVGCRKLKERFSRHWKTRGVSTSFDDFRGRAEVSADEVLGRLKNASLEEFMRRARAYRPSSIAKDYFSRLGSDLRLLGDQGPVDLIGMIRQAIENGPELACGRDFAVVILTGGSSSWPFMVPLVSEIFGVSDDAVFCSTAPEKTIGEGLAIYNVVRHQYQQSRQAIIDDLPNLKERISKAVSEAAVKAANGLSIEISQQVLAVARRHYNQWYNSGGSLNFVEGAVRKDCGSIPVRAITEKRLTNLSGELKEIAEKVTVNWMARHGIKQSFVNSSAVSDNAMQSFDVDINIDVSETVGTHVSNLLSAVSAVVVAVVSGGSGMALIAAGPLGLVAGAILGGGAVIAGKDVIRKKVSEYYFEGKWLTLFKMVFSHDKLEQALTESEQDLIKVLNQHFIAEVEKQKLQLEQYADAAAEDALKRFGIFEHLS
jgi:hypothetical protein